MFIRAAGIAGVVVLLSACGGPDRSPFVLWWERDQFSKATGGIRTGMPLDSLEHFWPPRSTSSRARSTSSSSRRSRGARGTATASPPAIRDSTSGTLDVTDGSLYVSLHRLEERGLVDSEWGLSDNGKRARFYRLTTAGRQQLKTETAAWQRYVQTVTRLLTATTQPA